MTIDQAAEVKRRFDDVYRTLLVIGPVLSFAFSNYAASNVFKQFVYDFGYPALMTSILIWALAHFLGQRWEYHIKLIGYVIIWFTFLVLASMVYVQGDPAGSIWYEVAAGLAVLITFLSGRAFAKTRIISSYYDAGIVVLAILLSILVPFLVTS